MKKLLINEDYPDYVEDYEHLSGWFLPILTSAGSSIWEDVIKPVIGQIVNEKASGQKVSAPVKKGIPEPEAKSFVLTVYNSLLKRNPDESGFRYWVNQLTEGNISKTDLIKEFKNSDEYKRIKEQSKKISSLYWIIPAGVVGLVILPKILKR